MKKLLLILLVCHLGFGQTSVVEVRLVNMNIGTPAFNSTTNNTTESNNAGLNAILQAHNVFSYIIKGGHLYPPFNDRHTELWCGNCNPQQLTADLLAYSSVVEKARVTTYGAPFDDNLYIQVQNLTTGNPTGTSNGVIVTNDAGLNQIFQNFNVYYYVQAFPSATTNSLQRYYSTVCNCNNSLLKAALDNYNSVINHTEYPTVAYLLGNTNFTTSSATIHPNPFTNSFTIETNEAISNYSLYDISGKQIVTTNSNDELNSKSQELNAGFYMLNLTFDNGQTANYKLIKK